MGYFDDWKVMDETRRAKAYFSINMAIQLLKVCFLMVPLLLSSLTLR